MQTVLTQTELSNVLADIVFLSVGAFLTSHAL